MKEKPVDFFINLKKTFSNVNWQIILFFVGACIVVAASFHWYAAANYKFFNSDMGVQVLMSYKFTWPRDVYYWGQNRTGSLLPFLSFNLLKVFNIHPILACSIVHYFFLIISAIIVCGFLNNLWIKLSAIVLIFLPMTGYLQTLLLGHPYAAQLFCGTLFCYFFYTFQTNFSETTLPSFSQKLKQHGLLFLCSFFFLLGIWISEFNAVFALVPLISIFSHPSLRDFKKSWPFYLHAIIGALTIVCSYIYLKSIASRDARYNKTFITSSGDIIKEFQFLMHRIKTTLLFDDHWPLNNWYYYFLAVAFIIILVKGKGKLPERPKEIVRMLLIAATLSFIILFFSSWNFISEIATRYYTIVYFMIVFSLLILADHKIKGVFPAILLTSIFLFSITNTWLTLIRHNQPDPFERYGEFRNLPRGTLISSYWTAYAINAIAVENLSSLPYDNEAVRNWDWKEELLSEKNIYFLKDDDGPILTDTLRQFYMNFYFTGIEFKCNDRTVKLYHKLN